MGRELEPHPESALMQLLPSQYGWKLLELHLENLKLAGPHQPLFIPQDRLTEKSNYDALMQALEQRAKVLNCKLTPVGDRYIYMILFTPNEKA